MTRGMLPKPRVGKGPGTGYDRLKPAPNDALGGGALDGGCLAAGAACLAGCAAAPGGGGAAAGAEEAGEAVAIRAARTKCIASRFCLCGW